MYYKILVGLRNNEQFLSKADIFVSYTLSDQGVSRFVRSAHKIFQGLLPSKNVKMYFAVAALKASQRTVYHQIMMKKSVLAYSMTTSTLIKS